MATTYETLEQRYQVLGELAAGGMGRVFLARQLGPAGWQRLVAIKRMHRQDTEDPAFVAMFLDEARVLARVQHPNVVPIVEFMGDDEGAAIIMDYVPGLTLSRLLSVARARHMTLPVPVVARIVVDCLEGLNAAHTARSESGLPLMIVHRDVSPQNILIGQDGVARVLDFGIARMVGRMGRTGQGELKGKLAYMSPEQLAQKPVDALTDVYALAVVAWECLAGRKLFEGDDEAALYAKVVERNIPHLDSAPAAAAFVQVIMTALNADRAQRPASARVMAEAIEGCCSLASRRQVAATMMEIAGQAIAERKRHIAQMSAAPAPSPSVQKATDGAPLSVLAQARASAEAVTAPIADLPATPLPPAQKNAPRVPLKIAIAAAGAAMVVAAVLFYLIAPGSSPPPARIDPPAAAQASPPVQVPAKAVPSSDKVEPPQAPPVATSATTISSQNAKKRRRRAPVDDCIDPFIIDSDGVRVPKRHCFK